MCFESEYTGYCIRDEITKNKRCHSNADYDAAYRAAAEIEFPSPLRSNELILNKSIL